MSGEGDTVVYANFRTGRRETAQDAEARRERIEDLARVMVGAFMHTSDEELAECGKLIAVARDWLSPTEFHQAALRSTELIAEVLLADNQSESQA